MTEIVVKPVVCFLLDESVNVLLVLMHLLLVQFGFPPQNPNKPKYIKKSHVSPLIDQKSIGGGVQNVI